MFGQDRVPLQYLAVRIGTRPQRIGDDFEHGIAGKPDIFQRRPRRSRLDDAGAQHFVPEFAVAGIGDMDVFHRITQQADRPTDVFLDERGIADVVLAATGMGLAMADNPLPRTASWKSDVAPSDVLPSDSDVV